MLGVDDAAPQKSALAKQGKRRRNKKQRRRNVTQPIERAGSRFPLSPAQSSVRSMHPSESSFRSTWGGAVDVDST